METTSTLGLPLGQHTVAVPAQPTARLSFILGLQIGAAGGLRHLNTEEKP